MKNKFFARFLSVLLCVCIFFTSITLTSFAVDVSDFNNALVIQYSNWSELPEDFKKLGISYANFFTDSDTFVKLFSNAADIPMSWFKILADGTPILNPIANLFYWLDDQGNLFVNNLNNDDGAHKVGGGSGRHRDDFVVPSETVKDYITEANTLYYPKNTAGKMTYRTDERYQNAVKANISNTGYYSQQAFYEGYDGFVACGGGNDMYMLLYYNNGTDRYYSAYQFHFIMTVTENYDQDGVKTYDYTLSVKYWDMLNGSEDSASEATVFENCEYSHFSLSGFSDPSRFTLMAYDTYLKYLQFSHMKSYSFSAPDARYLVKNDDVLTTVVRDNLYNHFNGTYANHDASCTFDGDCDLGYIASATPISMKYDDIDVQKIPDNYYITIGGDTLYDYSITNPETGQSDTINNYITNNYTYVTNNGGDNSGSGGVGGNVTVDGKVDIGGSVGVDINVSIPSIDININNGNGGNGSADYPDIDIVENLPETPQGFSDYLMILFDFLPAPVLALIIGGIAAAIFCRIWGR